MIVYKTLTAQGRSPYQSFKWPLPSRRAGRWVALPDGEAPVLCQQGFHGYLTLATAKRHGDAVYEMELDGAIVSDGEKAAGARARLLRRLWRVTDEPRQIVERGVRACRQCGKPHNSYTTPGRDLAPQWSDLKDGHIYAPETWSQCIARGGTITKKVEAERAAAAEARRLHGGSGRYSPVVPASHAWKAWTGDKPKPFADTCGTCGLGKDLHQGWRDRAKIDEEFTSYDRWELLEVIRLMRAGVPA